MVEFVTLLLVLAALASSSLSSAYPSQDDDLAAAIDEMRSAGYFSFVMLLLSVSPPCLFRGNVTFLLPDDKALSNNRLTPVHGISEFLLRHTIPSPLLFDYLQHIPTGSVLPTLEPEYTVGIDNKGGANYFLNNIKVAVPNVCVAGSSIRCHGIDDVLPALVAPSTRCTNTSTGTTKPEVPRMLSPTPPIDPALPTLAQSNHRQDSGCSRPLVYMYLWAFAGGYVHS